MAEREENIKKINEGLEQLSDEELDKVAGGTYTEWINLRVTLPQVERYDGDDWVRDYMTMGEAIVWMRDELGIKADISVGIWGLFSKDNKYTRNGESISHSQVLEEIREWKRKHPN